jgi:hypothetical protein
MKTACVALLALAVTGCASSTAPSYPNETFSADQLFARRYEFDKKVVRASFVWRFNFEMSEVTVWMDDGTIRQLYVDFDRKRLPRTAPDEWEMISDANREYWEKFKIAAETKTAGPRELSLTIDANVEVALPPPQKDKNVIVLGPDLLLKVVALHSVRKDVANKPSVPTPANGTPAAGAPVVPPSGTLSR